MKVSRESKFNPVLTPRQVIEAGAFGGSYFGQDVHKSNGYDYNELFDYYFKTLEKDLYLSKKYIPRINKFKTRSGMSYKYWYSKGWIHERDPYGWFEWWCKYNMGFRHPTEDSRQIERWNKFCGKRGRWRNTIYKSIHQTGNWNSSPRIQQSLLHWGYEVNEQDYQQWKSNNNFNQSQ